MSGGLCPVTSDDEADLEREFYKLTCTPLIVVTIVNTDRITSFIKILLNDY